MGLVEVGMLSAAKDLFSSLFLRELLKGMAVSGRHMFKRSVTVQFPEEKTPQS